jgi:hypothetical protein
MATRPRLLLTSAIGLLAVAGACSTSESFPDTAIEGSFAASNPWPTGPGYAIGFSLNIIGQTVSGQGWIGGAGNPLTPLTVVGQFTDPEFSLGLSSGPVPWGTITGTATASGLSGTYLMTQGATPVVMVFARQDSGAVGRYSGTTTGEFSGGLTGSAGFGVSSGAFFLRLSYPNRTQPLLELTRTGTRPGTGNYQVGPGGLLTGTITMGTDPNLRFFQVKSGQIRVDVSTPYAFIGELLIQAEEETTLLTVGVSITFSAGCAVQSCL